MTELCRCSNPTIVQSAYCAGCWPHAAICGCQRCAGQPQELSSAESSSQAGLVAPVEG